jgi:hypothetical protein
MEISSLLRKLIMLKKTRRYLPLFLFLGVTLFATSNIFGQINDALPDPKEYYSSDQKRLVRLSNLIKLDNGKANFSGKIKKVKWFYEYNTVYFEIGKTSFEVDYSNVSNAGRSHLSGLFTNGNKVSILAYAGGSNGIYKPIDIRIIK